MMRAWQVAEHGAPADVLRQVEIPIPTPGEGEVLLEVEAAGIGMPDAFMCRGSYAFSPPFPFTPGQEVCGRVVAVGEGASVAVGQRLMGVVNFFDGRGGLAEYAVANESVLFRVPESMSVQEAGGFRIGYSTALIGLQRRGQLREGETVVVLGASGGSGITAVQIAAALGARVIAVVSSAEKAALCRRAGASEVLDRTQGDLVGEIGELTMHRGADVIYDPVGGALADSMVGCIASGGRLLAVGFASGRWTNPPVADLVRRNASLVGVYAGSISRSENEIDHEMLLSMHATGKFAPFIQQTSFDDAVDAIAAVDEGSVVGKSVVVLTQKESTNEST